MSMMRCVPSIAAPPACSTMNARGFASYIRRSLPLGASGLADNRRHRRQQVAMEVRDERADVAHAERSAIPLERAIAPHQLSDLRIPVLLVRIVHREIAPVDGIRMLDARARTPNGRIERESVRALPRSVHQHRARPVDHVAGCDLARAGLQEIREQAFLPRLTFCVMEKIVPTGTFTSIFDEPSSGSNMRQYLPQRNLSGMGMISASSSDAMPHSGRCGPSP